MNATQQIQPTLDIAGTPRVPFTRLVRVELRKSYDTRSGFWLLASMGLLTIVILVILLIIAAVNDTARFEYGDFVGSVAFVTSILLPVLGILLVTSEWSQRTAMTTFTLEPHRSRVILAKLVTGIVLTLGVAVFAVVTGALANVIYGIIAGDASWNFGFDFFIGFLITQALAMLGGFALATLLLNSPASIVAFFAYKWVLPGLLALGGAFLSWFEKLRPWIDFQAAQGPLFDLTVNGKEWGYLLVSGAIWLGLPLAIGVRRVLRAEVK